MKLSSAKRRRFTRLRGQYLAFAQEHLDTLANPSQWEYDPGEEDLEDVERAWNAGVILSEFVCHNPASLSKAELMKVQQWDYAMFDCFYALRQTDGRLVLMGYRCAFEVSTVDNDAEEVLGDAEKTPVWAVLVPFEGRIIAAYLRTCGDPDVRLVQAIGPDPAATLQQWRAEGRLCATAEELMIQAARQGVLEDHGIFGYGPVPDTSSATLEPEREEFEPEDAMLAEGDFVTAEACDDEEREGAEKALPHATTINSEKEPTLDDLERLVFDQPSRPASRNTRPVEYRSEEEFYASLAGQEGVRHIVISDWPDDGGAFDDGPVFGRGEPLPPLNRAQRRAQQRRR